MAILFIFYELDTWTRDLKTDFTLSDYLFRAVKLTKNADPDKYGYSGYGIGFDAHSSFSVNGEWDKNFIIWSVDNSLSVHTDNRTKYIKDLGEGLTDGLDDTTIAEEAKYFLNFTKSIKKICLSLHHNVANSFLYANGVKFHQFKGKGSEIKLYPLSLGNILKGFHSN